MAAHAQVPTQIWLTQLQPRWCCGLADKEERSSCIRQCGDYARRGKGRGGAFAAILIVAVVAICGPDQVFAQEISQQVADINSHWIVGYSVKIMNCQYDESELQYWDEMADFLFNQQTAAASKLPILGAALLDVMAPYGVVDPVMALHCPLGTSAALHKLAVYCLEVFGARCAQRGLRLLHLSKLFMVFNFNDWGAWFAHSRWKTNLNELSEGTLGLSKAAPEADPSGGAAPIVEPMDFREPTWRIGLVSYCNYNDSYTKLRVLSGSNKKAYAERHGYTLLHFEKPFISQAHPWMNKLIAIQQNLADFDWLFWVDCDLFFMKPEGTVDALIRSALAKNADASLIIAEDGMMLNSGAFIMRGSEWSAEFLAKTADLLSAPTPYSFQHMPWHEQAPLIYLSMVPSIFEGLSGRADEDPFLREQGLSAGYDPRVVLLPQRAMNAYPPELVQRTKHAMLHGGYEEGDLVISFNGCSSILGGEYCEALYAQYHAMSMDRLQRS
eukprot:TRINITY_DN33174_c0_g1_i1.p1 TRINITY_DN33174_c0_g1~~TRINITY_DN33174_c0_g1_i1.p1  ORF type:complete len:530 (-),score=54.75 TRINITY_DN33174_c0_g1_i1:556-2049(-)